MNPNRALSTVFGAALALLGSPAMAIETPPHRVVQQAKDLEVREYASYVVAETEVEGEQTEVGNEAFRRLAGYIFGKNRGERRLEMTSPVVQAPTEGTKIAMTAPVTQAPTGTADRRAWLVQFMMPAQYTLDTLPEPRDTRVTLRALPARRVAVHRYSGTWSKENYEEHLATLKAAMQREGLVAKGEPVWARYDPPYTPWFLRTNEIQIEVLPPQGTGATR